MGAYLLSSRRILGSDFLSATNQAGIHPLVPVAGEDNIGGLTVDAEAGVLAATIDHRIAITGDGDITTSTWKLSLDGGTNYKGKTMDYTAAWNNGEGGASMSAITILADSATVYCSKAAAIDTDDDGIEDTAFVAITRTSTTPDQIDIYKTTTLIRDGSTAQTWAAVATSVCGGTAQATRPGLMGRGKILVLAYINTSGYLVSRVSTDAGVTWSSAYTVAITPRGTGVAIFDCCVVADNRFFIAYDVASTAGTVVCRSSLNGRTWTAAKQIYSSSDQDYEIACGYDPVGYNLSPGAKTNVYISRSGNQVNYSTAASNPAASTATWAEDDMYGVGGTAAVIYKPSMCFTNEGTMFIARHDSADTELNVDISGHSGGALATGIGDGGDHPSVSHILGHIWLTYNSSGNDAVVVFSRVWETFAAGKEIYTDNGRTLAPGGVIYTFGGGNGVEYDTYDIDSAADYGGDRMVMLTPSRPSRSTADGADWNSTFDLSANKIINIDTVAVIANVKECKFQGDTTSTFTPDASLTVSFVQETIAEAGVTWATGKVTRSSGTWTAHSVRLIGKRVRAGTSGQVAVIVDNDTTRLYTDTDMSAWTGDLQILSDRAWATQTADAYRYRRLLIENQQTAEDYYEVKALAADMRYELPSTAVVLTDYYVPATDHVMRSGTITRTVDGTLRRRFTIPLTRITVAQRDAIVGMIANQGGRPLVLIPDSTNAFDFAIVQPASSWSVRALRTEIQLIEVI